MLLRNKCSLLTFLLLFGYAGNIHADIKIGKVLTYEQPVVPEFIDNYRFATYYTNNKKAYNLRGFDISSPGGKIRVIKVNPAGHSYALLAGKNDNTPKVYIYPINGSKEDKREVEGLVSPSTIAYTPDSRKLIIADNGRVNFYDSKTLHPLNEGFNLNEKPIDLVVSPNGHFVIALLPDRVDVIAVSTGQQRASFPATLGTSVAFTGTSSTLGILSPDGHLTLYNTSDFAPTNNIDGLGKTSSLFFNPDENYAGMVADGNRIQFVNIYEYSDRPVVYESGVSCARFLRDGSDNLYLTAVAGKNIKYRTVTGFSPNYSYLVSLMIEERMSEWMKMRPGETELEYRERVNEESIRKQREFFANQAATELALTAGLGSFGEAVLGRYNPENGTLIISLPGIQDIYLTIPPEDMAGFGDGNNLEFSNPVYTVTPNNTFELIYVSVFNPTNGKTYVFDNLDRQNLDFLGLAEGFVSLDLIMQSSREDMVLKGIKDRIMEEAIQNKLLSVYTSINVDTHIEQTMNPAGERIRNYHVDFAYQVEAEGSATEDFAPGRYKTPDSNAAMSMLQIIRKAFSSEFASYLVPGKELVIKITGSADALPISGSLAYDNAYGEYVDEPCSVSGVLTTLTVTPLTGMTTNEQLAFMRACGVKREIETTIPEINEMKVTYDYNIEVSDKEGGQFRRISVSLIFVDAF
ncbi:MAG: WD40 repeat domain-containing protein [Bacteroides sp.]|nr:WD40 repeat domain-containing protein [Bacteroides sp.]